MKITVDEITAALPGHCETCSVENVNVDEDGNYSEDYICNNCPYQPCDCRLTEMQKLWDQENAHISVLLQRTADRKEKREKDKKDK